MIEKPVQRSVQMTPDQARRLEEFKEKTGIPSSFLVRAGIQLALQKYGRLQKEIAA